MNSNVLCIPPSCLAFHIPLIFARYQLKISEIRALFQPIKLQIFCILTIRPLLIWPERPQLQTSMPMCFRNKFVCKITTIIDCFELFIDRPTNLTARNLTWSNYKSHNTSKYLICITPQGTISFISKGWVEEQVTSILLKIQNF